MLIKILNESKNKAEILIYDGIGYELNGKKINQLISEIKSDEILVRINSGGGSVFEGFSIYNSLAMCGKKVITRVEGIAASISSVIALAGEEVQMCENAYLMIHNPSSCVCGDAELIRKIADVLDRITDTLVDIYEEKTGLDRDKIQEMMDKTTYMDCREAIELKFADRKVKKSKLKVKIAAELLPEDIPEDVLRAINGERETGDVRRETEHENPTETTNQDQDGHGTTGGSMKLEELLAALGAGDPEAAIKGYNSLKTENTRLTAEIAEQKGNITNLEATIKEQTEKLESQEKSRKESIIANAITARQIDPKDKEFAENLMNQSEELFNAWFEKEKAKHKDDALLNPLNVRTDNEGAESNPYEFDK
jgi:ATP-dependent Clp endopeptidase proteolytic subunit ClpP